MDGHMPLEHLPRRENLPVRPGPFCRSRSDVQHGCGRGPPAEVGANRGVNDVTDEAVGPRRGERTHRENGATPIETALM